MATHLAERRVRRRPAPVYAACAASLLLGFVFVFVRAPHPWGWDGFDHYHDIALILASGRDFPTLEVPWGYAYFLAAFYRVFGDRPWIPLTVQVLLNAFMPLLVFEISKDRVDRGTATLAAVLTGLLSFNTVYASTQSSDAVCTCIFITGVVVFGAALQRDDWRLFALAGILTGIAPQFRPNLILIPIVLAAFAFFEHRTRRGLGQAFVLTVTAGAMLLPWVVRNYELTHTLLPTSAHGGVQLWYGTLQTGPYLDSRAHNPRSVFEAPAFEYTSLSGVPLIVSASLKSCAVRQPQSVSLTYWSDRDGTKREIAPLSHDGSRFGFEIPPPGRDAVIYYYFTTHWPPGSDPAVMTTPPEADRAPLTYFVSQDHLGDLDLHGDLLDIFDIVRLARQSAWSETPAFADALHAAGIEDVRDAVTSLAGPETEHGRALVSSVEFDEKEARLRFSDGSTMTIPRRWNQRITDVIFTEGLASTLMTSSRSLAALRIGSPPPAHEAICAEMEDISINDVFYRREMHMMRRYSALALDNIWRDPLGFVLASAYRAVRLFVIVGSGDPSTTQQFSRGGMVYGVATVVSSVYFLLLLAGMFLALRRHLPLGLPALLIIYIPATLAPVLTNMRYTVTVQPVIFIFVAIALTTAIGWAARGRGETRTARRP
jgi:hypothetical protein